MPARRSARRSAMLAAVATALVAGGCFSKPKHPIPEPEPVRLDITNHAFADIDVYVLPSANTGGIRLTTVSGFAKASLKLRPLQLQPGGVLQMQLHAIGTTTRWITSALTVSPGEHVMLEIHADANGNLSRSMLYPLPDGDGDGGRPPPR